MKGIAVAVFAGALFAVGLLISGMTLPARVTAFLDVGGAWNPSLAFVMAGSIAIYAPVARLVRRRRAPLFDHTFHPPDRTKVDPSLLIGAALFGVGWGLSGYCPGPALVSVGAHTAGILVFVAAMLVGTAVTRLVLRKRV